MPQSSRIPTPIKQHWHRFRLGALPVISFLLCVAVVLTLWERQAYNGSFVGEVQSDRMDVIADLSGELTYPGGEYWQLFQSVKAGDLIAQLDSRPTLARLQTVQLQAAKLSADLQAASSDLQLKELDIAQQHSQELLRLKLDYESKRLEYVQMRAQEENDKATLQALKADARALERVSLNSASVNLLELQRTAKVLEDRLVGDEAVRLRNELKNQLQLAKQRLDAVAETVQMPEAASMLAPIEAGIAVQESLIEETKLELERLSIKAPIDGVITAIYRRPGQRVVAGDQIVTISGSNSNYVLSYVRDTNHTQLHPGMEVHLRLRQAGSPDFVTNIEEVGPQLEPVPTNQLRDQSMEEWATPIKIRIPQPLRNEQIRPGQLLNVIIQQGPSHRAR
ncbi:MAG: HlyD family efflux transporter periplasmic adaptor subunit [Planctomycetaceae bacterium]|nr:HlyD family efflux transporter periplasmic adaptor subunit [Planctomycetaceae bacterium]